jgi:nucleotide-binding universal stress UspA family protein
MKLLAATDFSPNANEALKYGLFLFGDRLEELVLLTAVDIKAAGALLGLSLEEDLEVQSYEKLMKISAEIQSKFPDLKITEVVRSGTLANVMFHCAEMYRPDFTIMGTNGTTGLYEKLVGSNTSEVMNVLEGPLIVVPYGYKPKKVETVILALEDAGRDEAAVAKINDLCLAIGAKLHILSFVEEDIRMEPMPFDSEVMTAIHFSQNQLVASREDVEDQILAFAKKDNADLICVIPRHKDFLSGLFHHSVTENIMAESDKPILVLS